MADSHLPHCPFDAETFARIIMMGLNGCCCIFAIELHRAKGYELVGFVDEADVVCHFACRNSAGELIDANGRGLTLEEVERNYINQGRLYLKWFDADEVEAELRENQNLGALIPPSYQETIAVLFQSGWWDFWEKFNRMANNG